MAVVDASAEGPAGAVAEVPAPQPEAPAVTGLLAGDPMALGLPVFIAGSAALGLTLAGMVPGSPLGAPLAIIMAATGIGLSVATAWAIAVGQSAVASVFGIFAGFWLSFAALVLGLNHNWFVLPAASVTRTVELFLHGLADRHRDADARDAAAAGGVHGAVRPGRARAAAGAARHQHGLVPA